MKKEFGVQLFGVVKELHDDLWGTLRSIKEAGYRHIEVCSDFGAYRETIEMYAKMSGGMSRGWLREEIIERLPEIRRMGLDIYSIHIFMERIQDDLDNLISFCMKTGIKNVVTSLLDIKQSKEKCYEYCELLNEISSRLKQSDITLSLHCHETDFEKIIDENNKEQYVFDILMNNCRESGIKAQLDTGWIAYAGLDVSEILRSYENQVQSLHLKDISKDYSVINRDDIHVQAGDGIVDFQGILKTAEKYCDGNLLLIVDQDFSKGNMLEDNIESCKYLLSIT